MKIRALTVLSVLCVGMSGTPVWAGPVGVPRSLSPDQAAAAVRQLEIKQEQVGRQLPEPPKGPALVRYMAKRSQLQDLINRIQSGQPVSPDEIDQALQPTYR
jgi:hypothetical protein